MTKPSVLLEICAGSLTSALIAQRGGADRIELCENLVLGGTTPSFGTLSLARKLISIPIHVLIRPRGGNFVYSEIELATMKMDIETCKEMGMNGVVLGVLHPDGTVNTGHCATLLETAKPMAVTFHRAFDETPDPFTALEDIIHLGFNAVLSSGRQKTALQGVGLLRTLNEKAGSNIIIIPCGGIRPDNLPEILVQTTVAAVHSAAVYHSDGLHQETDLQTVKNIVAILKSQLW